MSVLDHLTEKKLIQPPKWLPTNVIYLTISGSFSYGCQDTTQSSDQDVYGIVIPPKEIVFPHTAGFIFGFDNYDGFQQFEQHHVFDQDAVGGKGREYDFTILNIVKYFNLAMKNNPNHLDPLFVSHDCILKTTTIGNYLRENRHKFLHRGCWATFKGYAYSMLHKMDTKNPELGSKRELLREKYGFDVKFAMHLVRLLLEVEQLLVEHDLDLRRHSEQLKSIRRGEWTIEEIKDWANSKEKDLENIYANSKLPSKPDKDELRQILRNCLEMHYGSLSNVVPQPGRSDLILRQIKSLIETYNP